MEREEFKKRLNAGVILLDGAMGTMLQASGVKYKSSEEGNLLHEEVVKSIHQGYIDAGSQIIESNTFGGNRIRLQQHGLAHQLVEINKKGVQLAKEVAKGKALVAGSIGPTGKQLHPKGDLTPKEAYEIYQEQVKVLVEAGADLLLLETMISLKEAEIAVSALKKLGNIPLICTFAFNEAGLSYDGSTPEEVVTHLQALEVDCGGINCTDPKMIVPLIKRMKAVSNLPLLAQPNAGLPKKIREKWQYDFPVDEMIRVMKELIDEGVNLVGGCCGTTPEVIRGLKK